jgi:hypothetical protein
MDEEAARGCKGPAVSGSVGAPRSAGVKEIADMLEPSAQPHAAASPARQPIRIGWKEYLEFIEWDLRRIRVKIDTGARTSALDVVRYELMETAGGELMATLFLALDPRHPGRFTRIHTPVLRKVIVCNTAGMREERPLVETAVRIGPVRKRIRITITDRSSMRYRMILGREALANDFLIDVSRKYLLKNWTTE